MVSLVDGWVKVDMMPETRPLKCVMYWEKLSQGFNVTRDIWDDVSVQNITDWNICLQMLHIITLN